MPGGDGFEFCREVRSHSLHPPDAAALPLRAGTTTSSATTGWSWAPTTSSPRRRRSGSCWCAIQLLMKRYSDLRWAAASGAGMVGSLEVIGRARRAPGVPPDPPHGRAQAADGRGDPGRACASVTGEIVGASCGELQDEDAVYEFLAWEQGRFQFTPRGSRRGGPPLGESFDRLLLEGCRRLDEAQRGGSCSRSDRDFDLLQQRAGAPEQAQPLHLLVQGGGQHAQRRRRAASGCRPWRPARIRSAGARKHRAGSSASHPSAARPLRDAPLASKAFTA